MLLLVASMAALSVMAPSVQGQVLAFGACPAVTPIALTNAQLTTLLGVVPWFQFKKYSTLFDGGVTCVDFTFAAIPGVTDKISVVNRQFSTLKSRYSTTSGIAAWLTPNVLAKFGLSFPEVDGGAEAPFWIVGSDLATWASVWSCTNVLGGLFNLQNAWVLTSLRIPTPATTALADAAFTGKGISLGPFALTTQTNCPAK